MESAMSFIACATLNSASKLPASLKSSTALDAISSIRFAAANAPAGRVATA